ncbi:MAG: hypothetical protein R3F30_05435 [Planctomycetota bacterium]
MQRDSYQQRLKDKRRELMGRRDGLRLAFLVGFSLILLVVFFGPGVDSITRIFSTPEKQPHEAPNEEVKLRLPEIDYEIFDVVRDDVPAKRYEDEATPLLHLLHVVQGMSPVHLRAMGLPDTPVSLERLRAEPARFRAKPVWFEGELVDLGKPKEVPGLLNAWLTKGRIRTASGDTVFFGVMRPIPAELVPGSWVRVEGLFFKLKKDAFLDVDLAPYVIGPELRPAFKDFPPVKSLDPALLARIHDGTEEEARDEQPDLLYHVASYVLNRDHEGEGWKADYVEPTEDDVKAIKERSAEVRGKCFRLVGTTAHLQVHAAEANPLGIDKWSRLFLANRDLGFFEVRVPGAIPLDRFPPESFVAVYGTFYKRLFHETSRDENGVMRWKYTPIFVAAPNEVLEWKLVESEGTRVFRIIMGAITLLFIALFMILVRTDSRTRQDSTRRLLDIRKRRRSKAKA